MHMYVSRLGMQLINFSGAARVQDGVPTSYTDTDFALLAHDGPEIWISRSLRFTRLASYSSNTIRVCVASVSAEI